MGIAIASLWLLAAAARAEPQMPHIEFFTGFEASDNYASGYVGGGYAFGKGLYEKGWRLRAVGSLGRYHYDGTLLTDGVYVPTHFNGEAAFAAALVGYQFMPGAVIVKLFAGIEAEDQRIAPPGPNNSVQGSEIGLRLQAETWARYFSEAVPLSRRRLWHGLPGILQPGSARLSSSPAFIARNRGWRARQ